MEVDGSTDGSEEQAEEEEEEEAEETEPTLKDLMREMRLGNRKLSAGIMNELEYFRSALTSLITKIANLD